MSTTLFDVMLSVARRLGRYQDGTAVSAAPTWMADPTTFTEAPGYWDGGTLFIETTNPSGAECKKSVKILTFVSPGKFTYAPITVNVPTIGATFTAVHKRVPRSAIKEAVNTALRAARQARANRRVE